MVIADKQTVFINIIGIGQTPVNLIVEVFHNVVFGEIAGHDRATNLGKYNKNLA